MMDRLFDILLLICSKNVIIRMIDGTIDYEGKKENVPFDLLQLTVKGVYPNNNDTIDIVLEHLCYKW